MQGACKGTCVVRKAGTFSRGGRICFLLAVALFSLTLMGRAQSLATILGTVGDPSGAVIPGAKVTVTNQSAGFTRTNVTNSSGMYMVSKIPIGNYVITVEASGFQRLVRTGITLQVGQTLRLNLQMTLGQTSQQVTVSGTAAQVNTVNATVSDVVTGHQIENLSLIGRNYQTLTVLTPGAAPSDSFNPDHLGHNSSANISFNGMRSYMNSFEVEGAQNNDTSSGGPSPDTFPALDSIAEFRISTSNYGADTGMRAGAQIQIITKSGTKQFHGDAYEFVRNDKFDANDWFVNRTINPPGGNAPKRPLKWNLFGYTLGGPFYIPGVYNTHKDKTYFFWSESWARYREGTVIDSRVPSLRMRQGDFSECDPSSPNYNSAFGGACKVPIDPTTGAAFSGDMVPIDPTAQTLLNAYVPLPNNGPIGYLKAPSTPTNWRQEQIRVDQNVSDKIHAFVRYTQDSWDQNLVPALWSGNSYDSISTPWSVPAKNVVLNITDTIHPNLLNEFIAAYGDDAHVIHDVAGPGSPSGSIAKPANWAVQPIFPANATAMSVLPSLAVHGGTPFSFSMSAGDLVDYSNALPTITFKDNVVWNKGKHTIKTGVFYLFYRDHSIIGSSPAQGSLSFTGGGPLTTGNGLADMYLGRIAGYSEGSPYNYNTQTAIGGYFREHDEWKVFEPYLEDQWAVSRKLTLTIGARYTIDVPTYHRDVTPYNINIGFLPAQFNINDAPQIDSNGHLIPGSGHFYTSPGNGLVVCGPSSNGGTAGLPSSCQYVQHDTLQPRFGFAYDPTGSGKTAIRGGFGLFDDMSSGLLVGPLETSGTPPAILSLTASNILGYQNIVPGPLGPTSLGAFGQNNKLPSIMQYNVTVEHEFPGHNFLSVGWVGNLTRHLDMSRDLNELPIGIGTMNVPALAGTSGCDASGNCNVQDVMVNEYAPSYYFNTYRGFSSIKWLQTTANSNYNSLQVNFRHTVGYGLAFQTSYTYAHALDNNSNEIGSYGVSDSNLNRWYGTSSFNRAQVLTMNYVYNIPFFQHSTNAFYRQALGGWRFSGITSFYSGTPISFGCGVSGYSSGIGRGMQCNTVGPLKIQKGVVNDPIYGPTPTWFDSSVVQQPYLSQYSANGQSGMFGYMGRNVLTGPGENNWDLALFKDFSGPKLSGGEHSTLQFRVETFNTFNHPQWVGVHAFCGGQTPFGATCGDTGAGSPNYQDGEVSSARPPREMQLGLRFIF